MKYVFFGTPRFASLVLAGVLDKMPPIAVIANPDRPAGRKKILTPPAIKTLLEEKDRSIELLQPEKLSEIAAKLQALKPDLFIVAAYGKIIPQSILDIPRFGTIGVHPSLLPHYRGATPIQSAILAGEKNTGLSLYFMDAEVDHGPIVATKEISIGNMYYLELEAALAALGSELLLEIIPNVANDKIKTQTQDENAATFTSKFETKDAFIPWEDLRKATAGNSEIARMVWQKIRAFNPEPGAWTLKNDTRIKLLRADMDGDSLILREIHRSGKNPEQISGGLP